MGDKQNRLARILQFQYPRATLALEALIAHGEHFIHEKNIGVGVDGDREGQAHVHAAAVGVHRLIDELAQFREIYNGVETDIRLGVTHAQQPRIEVNILPAREHGVETRAQLQQAGHAPMHRQRARGRRGNTRDELEERALARSIAPDDTHRFARFNSETQGGQGLSRRGLGGKPGGNSAPSQQQAPL